MAPSASKSNSRVVPPRTSPEPRMVWNPDFAMLHTSKPLSALSISRPAEAIPSTVDGASIVCHSGRRLICLGLFLLLVEVLDGLLSQKHLWSTFFGTQAEAVTIVVPNSAAQRFPGRQDNNHPCARIHQGSQTNGLPSRVFNAGMGGRIGLIVLWGRQLPTWPVVSVK